MKIGPPCTFASITLLLDHGNSSHFFVRNSSKISPPPPLYSIHVCKKITRNFDDVLVTGIYHIHEIHDNEKKIKENIRFITDYQQITGLSISHDNISQIACCAQLTSSI